MTAVNQTQSEQEDLPPGAIELRNSHSLMPILASLASAGFNFRLEQDEGRVVVFVDPEDEAAARRELDAVRRENHGWPPRGSLRNDPLAEDSASHEPFFASALVVLALLAIFAAWGPYSSDWPILQRAAMDAQRVRSGDWWRVFTAMTLHAGFPHLLGNALAALFLGMAAVRFCGSGMAWLLIILAGASANALTAWTVSPPFRSIGASTATFAALGMVTAAQAIRNYYRYGRIRSFWHRSLVPIGAGVALLGILGTGPQTDLRGHLYGFLLGALFGSAATVSGSRRLPPPAQWALFAVSWGLMGLAWSAASAAVLPR